MYIEPNTNIRLLKDTPLDNTYRNTIYFASASAQSSYFSGLTKYSLTDYSYQRQQKTLRVGILADNLYDCNYLMFQNTSFGSKWFYAFITSVQYINNECSEITFEIDVMQTWFFDYEVKQSFVEREHAITDTIGSNTIPENLETGGYITTAESNLLVENLGIYIMVTEKLENQAYWNDPGIVGGFPVPCYWVSLGSLSNFAIDVLETIIREFDEAGKGNAIVAIFTAPYNMVSTREDLRIQTLNCASRTLAYTPKNNKLYTYPYVALVAVALGQGIELKYELFDDNSPQLKIIGGFGANMQVSGFPLNYEGQAENVQNMLSLSNFPICAWVSNYFQNWLAQNKSTLAINTIQSVGQIVAGGTLAYSSGGVLGGGQIVGGVVDIANTLATVYNHSIIPDKMVGNANCADVNAVSGKSGFYTFCRCIRPEYAQIIDEYFSMYGYATHRVKVPNRSSRPQWNYVKTQNVNLTGSVPADDLKKLRSIYDKGVTFWKNGANVGNYSLNNQP